MSLAKEIEVFVPTEANGETTLTKQTLTILLNQVYFIFRPSIQPTRQVVMNSGPLVTSVDFSDDELIAAGMTKFMTPEGTPGWINPRHVMLYHTPEIGIYVFVFPGGFQLGVKATGAEVKEALGV